MLDDKFGSPVIQGHGGGGKKSGSSSADDTLRSYAHVRIVDAISEGPIKGLVDGENSILINKTSISNIEDSAWQYRAGLPDDEPMIGINTTEAYVSVGAEVSEELGPVIRTITDTNLDAVRLLMQLNVLYYINKKGALKTTSSGWRVDLRPAGGNWTEVVTFDLNNEKTTSPTQFSHVIPLTGAGPWDLRVRSRYGERDKHEQSISWVGYSQITNGKFTHPHTAMIATALSSEHVGSSQPTRHYHVDGRLIKVPVNYNPLTRAYTGVWNGEFKVAWSDNPAWILYDMVENNIFGIGGEVNISVLSKWRLYTIAQYCDQLVPSGYKDASGNDVMEPRYTFNGVITDKKEAFDALRSMTTVWRGMGFYSLNQFFTTVDMPQDAAHIYGPANVIDGRFEYSTSSVKTRHSVVMVRFNDPNNLFEPAIEPVVDDEVLKKFGWREKTLELAGCSSRSLAHRYGKWVIETEKSETETVSFVVGLDSIHALPGEVIAINDPRRAEVRTSGRIASVSGGNTIVMDQVLDPVVNKSGATLYIHKPDGTIFTRTVNVQPNGRNISVGTGNAPESLVGCVFVISATNVTPRLYRILSIDEEASGTTFKITALQYDPNKFARVENGITFDPLPTTVDRSKLEPPTNLQVSGRAYTDGGRIRNDLNISWTPSPSQLVAEYRVYADTPTASNVHIGSTNRTSLQYSTYEAGTYNFRVVAISVTGGRSRPATASYLVEGISSIAVGYVDNLVNAVTLLGGANTAFTGRDVSLAWRNMMRVSSVAGVEEVDTDDTIYGHTTLEFFFGNTKVRTERVRGNSFIYTLEMNEADARAAGLSTPRRSITVDAYIVDRDGRKSNATSIGLRNPAPAAIAPSVEVDANYLDISWPAATDRDIAGYLVYVRQNDGSVAGQTPTQITNANSYRFKGVSLTDYWVSVVGYDQFGTDALNYATPLKVRTGFDGLDDDPPEVPTGLVLSGVINESTGLVDVTAVWNESVAEDFEYFQFQLTIDGGEYNLDAGYPLVEFTLAQGTTVTVRVRARDKTFNWSDWSVPVEWTAPVDNTPPATPTNFKLKPGWGAFVLTWDENTEPDMARYEIWESETATPPTRDDAASHISVSNIMSISGYATGERRYFAIRAVDLGDNKSDWTEVLTSVTTSTSVVTLPVPTGLAYTSALSSSTDADVFVTWDAMSLADHFDVEVTIGSRNPVVVPASGTSFQFPAVAGATGSIRLRARGSLAEMSEWTSAIAFTAAKDTEAPAQITGVTAKGGIQQVLLKWNASAAADLLEYHIYQSTATTNPNAATVPTYRSRSTVLAIGGLTEGATLNYWVRAVDVSGNAGAWSSRVNVKVTSVSGMIQDAITNATWATDLGFIKPYTGAALPTANIGKTIEWNGKLYTWNGTAYVSAADFSDITFENINGEVALPQIPDGLLTAEKIADKTLSAQQIADKTLSAQQIADKTLTAEQIADDTLTAQQIADKTLTAQQIADGAITAEELADGAVTPDKISETLDQFIRAQGTTAAADAAAAQAARLAAEGAAADAVLYRNETVSLKNTVEERASEITETAGIVSVAKQVSVLASGNERFQFGLEGWVFVGGRLTDLTEYVVNGVAPVWIFDPSKNVHHGVGITFVRASSSSVIINGTTYAIPSNTPRYFVTNGVRSLRITSTETMRLAESLGVVDVRVSYFNGTVTDLKGVTANTSWWPGNGDFLSIVAYPSGTLTA